MQNKDYKNYRLHTAEQIIKDNETEIYNFLQEHSEIYDEFARAEEENYTLANFLWYNYWNETIEYLNL